ncbi:MAG: GNAT family N-acetyltransferase [Candidatus Thermoplasmatota archaeon]|nr:GNAT family N-acetyltransferase [Candidatus Thermoplasmatota archaeon]
MNLSINAITDMSEFQRIEKQFDSFVAEWSENPFVSSVFIKNGAQLSNFRGWKPLLLIVYDSDKIVGMAPLAFRKRLGILFVQFLYGPNFLMDFVVHKKYREVCVKKILHTLISFYKCRFVDLTFSEESSTLKLLKKVCTEFHIYFKTMDSSFGGHRVISLTGTWDDFVNASDGKVRRKLNRIERKFRMLGDCRITCVERLDDDPMVCEKIIKLDGLSWKKNWMDSRGIAYDPELSITLNAVRETDNAASIFTWKTYFLELNGKVIAYLLIFRERGSVIFKRASYDNAYKKFSPGIFLFNDVIREIFDEENVKVIDWCADHRYQKLWASILLSNTVISIRNGFLLNSLERLLEFPIVKRVAFPLYCLKCLLLTHRANPLVTDYKSDQNEFKFTDCGENLS